MSLFSNSNTIGTFKGFVEHGLEFAAEIIAPYDSAMVEKPQLGQFVLIELGDQDEASLGRITKFIPTGLFVSPDAEDYLSSVQTGNRKIPADLLQQRLRYRVNIKLLGAVRNVNGKIVYVPSQRRLPNLGSKVVLPSDEVLGALCSLSEGQTVLGKYVLGEFVYEGEKHNNPESFLRSVDPDLNVTFDIRNLVSKRTVVFARAGYGKSNLMKLLISELYRNPPKTDAGLPVGTLIFDADGEYFWPDTVKTPPRPGLCNVPHLQDKLVVFTNRAAREDGYQEYVKGKVKLDIRYLKPYDVVSIAIPPDKQVAQNVIKLKTMHQDNWVKMVDLMAKMGMKAPDEEIAKLLGYDEGKASAVAAEVGAAKSNMNNIVISMHEPESQLLSNSMSCLQKGGLAVIDISLLSSKAGEIIAGLLMRQIFNENQERFTGENKIIPAIVVIEEAQSVLGRHLDETSPFVEWVKEGRKYELGAILVTQQPGSIASEILSQSDNWFSFHLLSEGDARVLGMHNSHFSADILSMLIGEPIVGNCYMWSAPKQPFAVPVRVSSFEKLYPVQPDHASRSNGAIEKMSDKISAENEEWLKQYTHELKIALNHHTTRFIAFQQDSDDGVSLVGVKTSQLYILTKKIKDSQDTRSESEVYELLLRKILGETEVTTKDFEGYQYFCSALQTWRKSGITNKNIH